MLMYAVLLAAVQSMSLDELPRTVSNEAELLAIDWDAPEAAFDGLLDQDRDRIPRPVPTRRAAPVDDFSRFGIRVGLLGARDVGGFHSSGFGADFEMQYNITPQWSVAFRTEGVEQFGGNIDGAGTLDLQLKAIASYSLKGLYYLTEGPVHPFVALGLGYYGWGGESISSTNVGVEAGAGFGAAPQVGIDLGGFRLAATYNHIFSKNTVEVSIGNTKEITRDYLTFELSFGVSF